MGIDDDLFFDDPEIDDDEEGDDESAALRKMHEEALEIIETKIQVLSDDMAEQRRFLKVKLEFVKGNIPDIKVKVKRHAPKYKQKGDREKPLTLINPHPKAEVRVRGRMCTWYKYLEELLRMCYPDIKGSLPQYFQTVISLVIEPILNGEEIDIKALNERINDRKNSSVKGTIKAREKTIKELRKSEGSIQKEIRAALFQEENGIDGIQTRFEHSRSIPARNNQTRKDRLKRAAARGKRTKKKK